MSHKFYELVNFSKQTRKKKDTEIQSKDVVSSKPHHQQLLNIYTHVFPRILGLSPQKI